MENEVKITDAEMEELIKKAKNEYNKKWRREHKDTVKEYNRKYWEKKALQMAEGEQ